MSDKIASVEQVVREALKSLRPDAGVVDGRADLTRELGLDSVQVMDMVMEIEDRLDISIPVETLADARTLDQLCAGIARLLRDLSVP
ncbi:MAG: acyl carrier protein [Panacagrimonas sp.]